MFLSSLWILDSFLRFWGTEIQKCEEVTLKMWLKFCKICNIFRKYEIIIINFLLHKYTGCVENQFTVFYLQKSWTLPYFAVKISCDENWNGKPIFEPSCICYFDWKWHQTHNDNGKKSNFYIWSMQGLL